MVGAARTLKRVEMTAALGSGSAPRPSLPQPRPRAPRSILGSARSRFEATEQPFQWPSKAADPRPQSADRYVLYCRVFEALLPARTVLHSAGKMALDQFCHVPLLFLPVFYSVG